MSKSIKLKNDNYLDSSSVSHKRKALNDVLNNYIEVKYDGSLGIPASFDNRIRVPFGVGFNGSNGNLYLRDNCVVVGKNINRVKIDYNVRLDWDAPTSITYAFIVTTTYGDQWITHRTAYKTNLIQYGICVSSFLLDVEEGTEIALLTYVNEGTETQASNCSVRMFVQAIE